MLYSLPNELVFFVHVTAVIGFLLFALRLGTHALTATICLYGILANLFVTQQITLFGLDVTSSDVFAVGGILGLNIIQEFFGRSQAIKTIFISFSVVVFYLVLSLLHLAYTPNVFDVMRQHFTALLTPMPRIIIASVCVYLVVQLIDAQLYAKLKQIFGNKHLIIRNVFSLSLTQLLDTVLFSFGALYGTVHSVVDVIIVGYCIKLIVIACGTPFISFAQSCIKPGIKNHE